MVLRGFVNWSRQRKFHGKVDFHALRVTHVTLGIELGFDAKTAQTLARHRRWT